MTNPTLLRDSLAKAGIASADLDWLESFGFNDAAVPAAESAAQAEAYERRAKALSASVQGLSLWERESHPAAKLAAAIGAQAADWRDRAAGEDEE